MKDDLKQRAVRGGLWFGGSRWAIQGLTWIATIFVARILSPADYGLFGFAVLVTGLIDLINELGLGAAIVQRRDLTDEALETVFWFSMACSVVVYGFVWLVAPWIAAFFGQPQLVPVLRVITLTFPIGSLRIIPWNLLTKRVDFKHRSLAEVAGEIRLKLGAQQARKLAIEAGVKSLQHPEQVNNWSVAMTVSRMQPLNLPAAAIKSIFRTPSTKLPAYVGAETADGYRLYRIDRITAGKADPEVAKRIRSDMRRLLSQEEMRAYLENLKARASIKIDPTALEPKSE